MSVGIGTGMRIVTRACVRDPIEDRCGSASPSTTQTPTFPLSKLSKLD